MFNPLHSIINQKLFERYLCDQSSHYEKNVDDVCYEKGSHQVCVTVGLTHFAVNKDKCNAKHETSKFMKNALFIRQFAKRHLIDAK